MANRRSAIWVMVLTLPMIGGCFAENLPGVAISGYVTYEGKPIPMGIVMFSPPPNEQGRGGTGQIRNGRYTIPRDEGPYPGLNEVSIVEFDSDTSDGSRPGAKFSISKRIPEIYHSPSILHVQIPKRSSIVYSFDLVPEAKAPRD